MNRNRIQFNSIDIDIYVAGRRSPRGFIMQTVHAKPRLHITLAGRAEGDKMINGCSIHTSRMGSSGHFVASILCPFVDGPDSMGWR